MPHPLAFSRACLSGSRTSRPTLFPGCSPGELCVFLFRDYRSTSFGMGRCILASGALAVGRLLLRRSFFRLELAPSPLGLGCLRLTGEFCRHPGGASAGCRLHHGRVDLTRSKRLLLGDGRQHRLPDPHRARRRSGRR
jgi:hypothetical protein